MPNQNVFFISKTFQIININKNLLLYLLFDISYTEDEEEIKVNYLCNLKNFRIIYIILNIEIAVF